MLYAAMSQLVIYRVLLIALLVTAVSGVIWLAVGDEPRGGIFTASTATPTAQPPAPTQAPIGEEPSQGRLNINTATATELDALPEIGQVLAGRIVAFREANGPFTATDQLMLVQGIGQITYERLRDLVTVGD